MVENNASARLVPFRAALEIRGFAFIPILGMLMPILGMFKRGAFNATRDVAFTASVLATPDTLHFGPLLQTALGCLFPGRPFYSTLAGLPERSAADNMAMVINRAMLITMPMVIKTP